MMIYHFKPLDKGAEVGVFPVVGDEGRLDSLSGTFNVHTRPIHLGQIHPLQVPQAPEQNLRDSFKSLFIKCTTITEAVVDKNKWS